ncbi:MAG: nuclear transport factor 2 family protein [Bacteroidota bacterium]
MKRFKMRLIPALVVLLIMIHGCSYKDHPAVNNKEIMEELDGFISNWHQYAAISDHADYIGGMAEDGIYIGTDATELWTTKEFSAWSKPFFDQKRGWDLVKLERHIYTGVNGQTAWFDELLDTSMGLCRGSGVLLNINGSWKIIHYVLSPTVPNELTSQVKALKFRHDSLIISSLKLKP